MADTKSDGPSTATIVLIAVLATPVVLVLIFWLVGSGKADARSTLPDVRGKGLQWANAQTKDAGFGKIETHDALGRDRRWGDNKAWMVCFEDPKPGALPSSTKVTFGVVKIEERCPTTDQARYVKAVAIMPNLVNRTAYMTTKILGDDASIKFVDKSNGHEVTRSLGDWRICGQAPEPGQRFDGVPVTTLVVPYEQRC
jgi:hypothetical protein